MDRIRHRRQFVLGPADPGGLEGWARVPLGPYVLTAHPDAVLATARRGGVEAATVGVAVDPARPGRTAGDLAGQLAAAPTAPLALDVVDSWAGGFVAVRVEGARSEVHHDAGGLREVFYTTDGAWAAADPALLARVAELSPDPEAEAFERSRAFEFERLWPGTRTRFAEVRRLLPNHVLRLPEGRAERAFPRTAITPTTLEEGAEALATRLGGTIEALVARGPARLALTAGWDSRMLLAASRPVVGRLGLYQVVHAHTTPTGADDLRIGRRLAARVGAELDEITYPPEASPAFTAALEASVTGGHRRPALLEGAFLDRPLTLHGVVSEIARHFYARRRATPEGLARLRTGTVHPVPVAEYARWLAEAEPVAARVGIDVLDLFYWEQRVGVWAANWWTEAQVASPQVAPFSDRPLLRTLMGVPPRLRGREHNPLYAAAIRRLWPELLAEPVNPGRKTRTIRAMERLGVYEAYGRLRDGWLDWRAREA